MEEEKKFTEEEEGIDLVVDNSNKEEMEGKQENEENIPEKIENEQKNEESNVENSTDANSNESDMQEGKIEPEEVKKEIFEPKEEVKEPKVENNNVKKEENKEAQKKLDKNTIIKISAISATVVILIIAIIIGFSTKRTFEYDRPIPYIWNEKLLHSLLSFTSLKEHDEFVLLYGPHGYGKTRAIREFAKFNSTTTLPFIFDFRVLSKSFTLRDVKELLKTQLIETISSIPIERVTKLNTFPLIQALTSITELQSANRDNQHIFIHKNKDMQEIGNLLCTIAGSVEKNPSMVFRVLFDAIDVMQELNPRIFLIHVDNLMNNENKEVADMFKSTIQSVVEFSSALKRTPIILEVSNCAEIRESLLEIPQARLIYVDGFTKNEAKETLTDQKIFSLKSMLALYKQFGGYGTAFAQAMDLSRFEGSISKVIDTLLNEEKNRMARALFSETNSERNEKLKLLKEVSKKKEIAIPKSQVYKKLIASGILTFTQDAELLTFQSLAAKKVFEDYFL